MKGSEQEPVIAGRGGSGIFTLYGGERQRALAPEESQQLARLLAKLPAAGMSLPPMSCDGVAFCLVVVRAGGSRAYAWNNVDWQHTGSKEWTDVGGAW